VAQLNFSGPWENVIKLWQYLLLQLYRTLRNQFSISFPYPSAIHGYLTPVPIADTYRNKLPDDF